MLDAALRTDAWKHERSRPVSNGAGGWTQGSFAGVQDLRIRVRHATAREVQAAGQLGAQVSHVAYAPVGSGVQRGDRFRQGTRALLVHTVAERRAPVGVGHLEAQCLEVVLQPQPGEDHGTHES